MLLEVLLAAACLLAICAALTVSVRGLQRYYYKTQVRLAADTFAADIRWLQQETMFSTAKFSKTLYVDADEKKSYSIYVNDYNSPLVKKVVFAEIGLSGVYFDDSKLKISFANNGSPKENGTHLLRHEKLQNFYCRLSLQPVTGRVTVTEYGS